MNPSRRDFVKLAAAAGAATLIEVPRAEASAGRSDPDSMMGVLVDIPKCIGCRRCEFACQEATKKAAEARGSTKEAAGFGHPSEEAYEDKSVFEKEGVRRPKPNCHTKISRFPNPDDPGKPLYVKYNCFHCNDPACVSACLVGAFHKLAEGPVLYDAWKCMGCRYCMIACPFGIPTYEYGNALTPQVRKCTLCADPGNPNRGKVPACVKICPEEVMIHGRRSDLVDLAHERVRKRPEVYLDHVYGEHEAGGTAWLYLAPKVKPFAELGLLDVGGQPPPMRTERIQHGVFKYFIPPLAWYGLLGAVMWVSRPERGASGGHSGHGRQAGG